MPHSEELGAGLLHDSSEQGEPSKRPSNLNLAICTVVVAVLVQLALLIALLSVESNAADVAAAAAGGGATTGGAARTYCTISATGSSLGSTPSINADINAALQDGCTLVGGLGVGYGGTGFQADYRFMTFGQALMCASGTGCAK